MKFQQPILLALATSLVAADKAPKIKKNPADVIAIADFPQFGGPMLGNVVFTAKKGKEVNVHVDVTKLPPNGGPFYYHIHQYPIPENGNCEDAGLHFNPYKAPADNCDNEKNDAYCQVGDLSGKHGWINTTCFETKYNDKFLSLDKKSKSNIIGRSIVFHDANMNKFACANIVKANDIRLKSLEVEYDNNGNEDLAELKEFVGQNYQYVEADEDFEDDEVATASAKFKRDSYEYVPNVASKSGGIVEEDDEDDEDNGVDCDNKSHHHNQTNNTNFTNLSSVDSENNAIDITINAIAVAIGLGAAIGMFL